MPIRYEAKSVPQTETTVSSTRKRDRRGMVSSRTGRADYDRAASAARARSANRGTNPIPVIALAMRNAFQDRPEFGVFGPHF
jgi:hypothetical protein